MKEFCTIKQFKSVLRKVINFRIDKNYQLHQKFERYDSLETLFVVCIKKFNYRVHNKKNLYKCNLYKKKK